MSGGAVVHGDPLPGLLLVQLRLVVEVLDGAGLGVSQAGAIQAQGGSYYYFEIFSFSREFCSLLRKFLF